MEMHGRFHRTDNRKSDPVICDLRHSLVDWAGQVGRRSRKFFHVKRMCLLRISMAANDDQVCRMSQTGNVFSPIKHVAGVCGNTKLDAYSANPCT